MMEEEILFKEKRTSFTKKKLETKGCCFLCLTLTDFKSENGNGNEAAASTLTKVTKSVNLKSLCRYLKILTITPTTDIKKLPEKSTSAAAGPSSSGKEIKYEDEDIEVDLCKSCGRIVRKLSKLFLSLEKIQMEVNYWLECIQKVIPNASSNPDLVQNYSKRMTSDTETLTQLVFVDKLRKEIAAKILKNGKGLEAKLELERLDCEVLKKHSTTDPPPSDQVADNSDLLDNGSQIDYLERYSDNEDDIPNSSFYVVKEDTARRHGIMDVNAKQKQNIDLQGTGFSFIASTGKYSCTICKKEYLSRSSAIWHYKCSHRDKTLKCDICKVSAFSHQAGLSRHRERCRNSLQKRLAKIKANRNNPNCKYTCPTCGKRFIALSSIEVHQKIVHLKERNFICDICKKGFASRTILKEHKDAIHFGKTFNCRICYKQFRYRSSYQKHKRVCKKKIKLEVEISA